MSAMSVKELAKYLGIGLNLAYQLVHQEDFPAFKIGKRLIIPEEQLNDWLKLNSKTKKEGNNIENKF